MQADCLGAAALFGAVADGTLELDVGDERELISSLTALADEHALDDVQSDHGDPFQRVQWFTIGRNGGVQACFDAAGIQQTRSRREQLRRTHQLIPSCRPRRR